MIADAGFTPIAGGTGTQITLGVGPRFIMGAGTIILAPGGFGRPTAFGDPLGSLGGSTILIAAGRRGLHGRIIDRVSACIFMMPRLE